MQVDSNHPRVAALLERWNAARKARSDLRARKSRELHRQLMRDIVEPQLTRYEGELILEYHQFLTMKPSGVHSFAHGSEMVSDAVFWVSVGRIDGTKLRRERAHTRSLGGEPELRIRIAARYLVPLRSAIAYLAPRYAPGKHQPHFALREPKPNDIPVDPRYTLDVSSLGDHLFTMRPGKHDWYTKIEIVIGTNAVRAWLAAHNSEEVYHQLRKQL